MTIKSEKIIKTEEKMRNISVIHVVGAIAGPQKRGIKSKKLVLSLKNDQKCPLRGPNFELKF